MGGGQLLRRRDVAAFAGIPGARSFLGLDITTALTKIDVPIGPLDRNGRPHRIRQAWSGRP